MNAKEANENIGAPFKWSYCIKWDIIKEVTPDGFIVGEFLIAPIEDCRLKQAQPPQLVKNKIPG